MPDLYDVVRSQDGALVIRGVDIDTASSEKARLNAEARVVNPATGRAAGMYLGFVVAYEVRSKSGVVV